MRAGVVNGQVQRGPLAATIEMVALQLSWAGTVHSVQGLALDNVHIDCTNAFAPGHEYTALSRARTLGGLTMTRVPTSIHSDVKVRRVAQPCEPWCCKKSS